MRTLTRSGIALAATVVAGAFVLGAAPIAAQAHDTIVATIPADGEVLTADPGLVSLDYSSELLALGDDTSGFAIQVTNASGAHFASGCVTVSGVTAATEMMLGAPGDYTVQWQVVSSDGHPTSGSYVFSFDTTTPGAGVGQAEAPVCGATWAGTPPVVDAPVEDVTEDPVTEQTEAPAETTDAEPGNAPANTEAETPWLGILAGVGGLAVLATIITLVVRRSKNDPFPSRDNEPTTSESEATPDNGDDSPSERDSDSDK